MVPLLKEIGVAVISPQVSQERKHFPYFYDNGRSLGENNVRIHCVRIGDTSQYVRGGVIFHRSRPKINSSLFKYSLEYFSSLPLKSLPINFYKLYSYGLYVSKITKQYNLDLIHSHFAFYEGFVGLLAKAECHKPLIVTVHGIDINTVPEIGYGARLVKRYDTIVRKVLKEADAVVAVGSDLRNKCIKLGAHSDQTFFIPNGVDTSKFSPSVDGSFIRTNLVKDNRIDLIIFTARQLWPVYGVEFLIKAAKLVVEKYPHVLFVITGDGPLKTKIEKLILDLDLRKNVKLIGNLSTGIESYMAASDIYINPSLSEGFGISTLEAMASGKPVIATRIGGSLDLVKDNITGLLCKAHDAEDLATKICYLIEHKEIAVALGRNGRKIAEKQFTIERQILETINLYRRLAN